MTFNDFISGLPPKGLDFAWKEFLWLSVAWFALMLIIVIVVALVSRKRSKGVDVTALAALAATESMTDEAVPDADPREVMAILSIEKVAASTALSAVKDARKSKKVSAGVSEALINRYKARIAKIDADLKRRSGVQEYKSLAASLEESTDRIRGEVMPTSTASTPPPPPSSTPGIPATAPPVPGAPPSSPPKGPPTAPPSMPSSPIPTPPKISPTPPTGKPLAVIPPSVAPPTISTPPPPSKAPTKTSSSPSPPTTPSSAPPPVPTSVSSTASPTASDSDVQSISGLRMEMLRELARLKKFMAEEAKE